MKEFNGLSHLRTTGADGVYCPSCSNYLSVVPNGFFHGDLFYCPKEKQVYAITLRKLKADQEYLDSCEKNILRQKTKSRITKDNAQEVSRFLDTLNS